MNLTVIRTIKKVQQKGELNNEKKRKAVAVKLNVNEQTTENLDGNWDLASGRSKSPSAVAF